MGEFKYKLKEREVGDTSVTKGIKSTVSNINPETGQISWDIEYIPAFDSVYKEFDDLRKVISQLDQKTDDAVVDDIASKIRAEFNRYRTHIRKNYPEAYKKFQIGEYKGTGKSHKGRKEPKHNQESTSDVKKALELIDKGFYLVDNNTALEHKEGGYLKLSQRVTNFFNKEASSIDSEEDIEEISTSGGSASFSPGTGAQYATPYAFKKGKGANRATKFMYKLGYKPAPSIPNRKSKAIDYKKL